MTCASGQYLLLIRTRTPAHDRCRLEAGRPSMRMQPAERKPQAAQVMGRWTYATSRAKTASADKMPFASGEYLLLIRKRTPAHDRSRLEAGRPSMRMQPAERKAQPARAMSRYKKCHITSENSECREYDVCERPVSTTDTYTHARTRPMQARGW